MPHLAGVRIEISLTRIVVIRIRVGRSAMIRLNVRAIAAGIAAHNLIISIAITTGVSVQRAARMAASVVALSECRCRC